MKISLPRYKAKTQRVVNKYIRNRDKDKGCISCGNKVAQAGHFIAQGSSSILRYNPDNIHGQCVGCNKWKHGNLIEYRINLVKRIGEDRVIALEETRHQIKKWTREELDEICKEYKI